MTKELLLSADAGTSRNLQLACRQLGGTLGADFAFKFGQNGFNWTGTTAGLFEKTADQIGYSIDWHGADEE